MRVEGEKMEGNKCVGRFNKSLVTQALCKRRLGRENSDTLEDAKSLTNNHVQAFGRDGAQPVWATTLHGASGQRC
jgi:hypothetical protein